MDIDNLKDAVDQAVDDFDGIKDEIEASGVYVGTAPTSEYDDLINQIPLYISPRALVNGVANETLHEDNLVQVDKEKGTLLYITSEEYEYHDLVNATLENKDTEYNVTYNYSLGRTRIMPNPYMYNLSHEDTDLNGMQSFYGNDIGKDKFSIGIPRQSITNHDSYTRWGYPYDKAKRINYTMPEEITTKYNNKEIYDAFISPSYITFKISNEIYTICQVNVERNEYLTTDMPHTTPSRTGTNYRFTDSYYYLYRFSPLQFTFNPIKEIEGLRYTFEDKEQAFEEDPTWLYYNTSTPKMYQSYLKVDNKRYIGVGNYDGGFCVNGNVNIQRNFCVFSVVTIDDDLNINVNKFNYFTSNNSYTSQIAFTSAPFKLVDGNIFMTFANCMTIYNPDTGEFLYQEFFNSNYSDYFMGAPYYQSNVSSPDPIGLYGEPRVVYYDAEKELYCWNIFTLSYSFNADTKMFKCTLKSDKYTLTREYMETLNLRNYSSPRRILESTTTIELPEIKLSDLYSSAYVYNPYYYYINYPEINGLGDVNYANFDIVCAAQAGKTLWGTRDASYIFRFNYNLKTNKITLTGNPFMLDNAAEYITIKGESATPVPLDLGSVPMIYYDKNLKDAIITPVPYDTTATQLRDPVRIGTLRSLIPNHVFPVSLIKNLKDAEHIGTVDRNAVKGDTVMVRCWTDINSSENE